MFSICKRCEMDHKQGNTYASQRSALSGSKILPLSLLNSENIFPFNFKSPYLKYSSQSDFSKMAKTEVLSLYSPPTKIIWHPSKDKCALWEPWGPSRSLQESSAVNNEEMPVPRLQSHQPWAHRYPFTDPVTARYPRRLTAAPFGFSSVIITTQQGAWEESGPPVCWLIDIQIWIGHGPWSALDPSCPFLDRICVTWRMRN